MALEWWDDERHADLRDAIRSRRRTWLVTGAAGFIGSNLIEALLTLDQDVRGLDNFSTGRRSNLDDVRNRVGEDRWKRLTFTEGDIRDIDVCHRAAEGADVVLHQAALGSVPRSVDDPLASFHSNVGGFLNVIEAVRLGRVPRLVYASSSSVYGDDSNLPKREGRIGQPLSPYAATKYIDEVVAAVFQRTYDMETIGLRYFNVFGRRQDPNGPYAAVIPKWVDSLMGGRAVEINGDGETSRDFCFIDNVVQANLRAGLMPVERKNGVYNVAIGGRATLIQLFHAIRDGLEAAGCHVVRDPVYQDFRKGDVRHSQADIANIVADLGYVPQFDLADGIRQTLAWYMKEAAPALSA